MEGAKYPFVSVDAAVSIGEDSKEEVLLENFPG